MKYKLKVIIGLKPNSFQSLLVTFHSLLVPRLCDFIQSFWQPKVIFLFSEPSVLHQAF